MFWYTTSSNRSYRASSPSKSMPSLQPSNCGKISWKCCSTCLLWRYLKSYVVIYTHIRCCHMKESGIFRRYMYHSISEATIFNILGRYYDKLEQQKKKQKGNTKKWLLSIVMRQVSMLTRVKLKLGSSPIFVQCCNLTILFPLKNGGKGKLWVEMDMLPKFKWESGSLTLGLLIWFGNCAPGVLGHWALPFLEKWLLAI